MIRSSFQIANRESHRSCVYFKNTMSSVTFFFHSCVETFLKSTRRAAAPIIPVHSTIVISSARIRRAVTNRALEETFTAFACADSVMFPCGFIAAHSTFLFWLNFGKINDGWISTGRHDAPLCMYHALDLKAGWKTDSCIQFCLIIYSTMARSGHKLSECQILILKGRQLCLL